MNNLRLQQDGDDVLLWIKAVPGASRDQIAGMIGERLKVRINAPAEDGKANQAICRLLAHSLGVKPRQVSIEAGHTSPEKIVRMANASIAQVQAALSRG